MGLLNELILEDPIQSEITNALIALEGATVYNGRGGGKQRFTETTIPIIKAALNKQLKQDMEPGGYCPACGHKIIFQSHNFCGNCGQAIRRNG